MSLFALGINHKTASVSLREKIAFSPDALTEGLQSLQKLPAVNGSVVLSTCNRTELYLSVSSQDQIRDDVLNWLCDFHQLPAEEVESSLYCYEDELAITHLMRVASGLDSLVLGEPQILGQVKKAFFVSQDSKVLSAELERLFQKAFSVAKRVRSETDIGASAVSVAFAACALARQIFESLSTLKVLLVGAGETIELVARYLKEHQVQKMIIANRTLERAQSLADDIGADVITLPQIDDRLFEADIVISSTASPLPIIGKGLVERALKQRKYQPMLFVDIAVPRDVEPEVGELSGVYLYTVDDLHAIIQQNLAQRQAAAEQAEHIIKQECLDFMAWLRSQNAVGTIREYRNQSENIRSELVAKALNALEQGSDAESVIQDLAYKLTNRLIHAPTKSLQTAASHGNIELLQVLRTSFGLDDH